MAVSVQAPAEKKSRGDTRARIVAAAAQLVYQHGFNATSLDLVARTAGVNRGSLYYFFRSKKNLALAVIDYYEDLLHRHYLDPALGGEGSGRERIERLAALYAAMPSATSPCCGCPLGNLSLELSGVDEELRQRLDAAWKGVFERIAALMRQAVEEGSLAPGADPDRLARGFFAQIQGAHLIARCGLDAEALARDCAQAVESLPWTS